MFGARTAMRRYLDLIRPWAVGSWTPAVMEANEFVNLNSDPSRMIFTIPVRPMPGLVEVILLGSKRADMLILLISWVQRFNDAAARYNLSSGDVARYATAKVAHGVVGFEGSNTLHDAFILAEQSL